MEDRFSTMFEDVAEFHRKFDLQWSEDPRILSDDDMSARSVLILEELNETMAAHRDGDLVKFTDGLADLAYVVLGTAVAAGIPFDQIWARVHDANMAKIRGITKRGLAVDVAKPEGWQPPDVAGALAQFKLGPK